MRTAAATPGDLPMRALREAAEALTATYTTEEVLTRIAENALRAANADSALVERIDAPKGEVAVVAVAGEWSWPGLVDT